MLRSVLLVAALCLTAAPLTAQPSDQEVAAARLVYIEGDYATALKVLIPAAKAGNPEAQNLLGDAYDDGNGVAADTATALDWWEKAAAQEFSKALHNLGYHYESRDAERARGYYERAIAQGNAGSMNNLGFLYEAGMLGAEPDYAAAAALYQQAVDAGNVLAMNNLGTLYIYSNGVEEDLDRALDLFRRAAETGDARGLANLGAMYGNGYGVGTDRLASMALSEMAARLGHPQAAINLAYDLIEVENGWQDPAAGWGWCLVALEQAKPADLAGFQEDCDYLSGLIDDETRAAGAALAPALLP